MARRAGTYGRSVPSHIRNRAHWYGDRARPRICVGCWSSAGRNSTPRGAPSRWRSRRSPPESHQGENPGIGTRAPPSTESTSVCHQASSSKRRYRRNRQVSIKHTQRNTPHEDRHETDVLRLSESMAYRSLKCPGAGSGTVRCGVSDRWCQSPRRETLRWAVSPPPERARCRPGNG